MIIYDSISAHVYAEALLDLAIDRMDLNLRLQAHRALDTLTDYRADLLVTIDQLHDLDKSLRLGRSVLLRGSRWLVRHDHQSGQGGEHRRIPDAAQVAGRR